MRAVIPDGWHYPQNPGSPPIRAEGFEELIAAVTNYRSNNGLPIGDPIRDIQSYVRSKWPHFAGAVSVSESVSENTKDAPLSTNHRERVSQWLANRYSMRASGHTELISESVAEARAQICAKCSFNQDIRIDCPPCKVQNDRTAFLLRQGRTTPTAVKFCTLLGHDNSVAVHLPTGMLEHRNRHKEQLKKEAPHCWMLNLSQSPTEPSRLAE